MAFQEMQIVEEEIQTAGMQELLPKGDNHPCSELMPNADE